MGRRKTYTSADAAVAFLDVFMTFTEGTLGLQYDCCIATMAASCIGFRVLDFYRWLRSSQWRVRSVGWLRGFAIIGVQFEGRDVEVS